MLSSRETFYFIYPTDKHGKKTGHCICVMLFEGRMFHGISLCSSEDQFNKEVGRTLAYERAKEEVEKFVAARLEALHEM